MNPDGYAKLAGAINRAAQEDKNFASILKRDISAMYRSGKMGAFPPAFYADAVPGLMPKR